MLVLSISSLKGGVGKTSVTLGLASAAQSRGIPTLVVDMDPQADASTGLDVPISTPLDIADVLAAPKSKLAREAMVSSGWTERGSSRLDVIPGSPRAAEFDRPSLSERYLKRLRDTLNRVSDVYRLVIIDCPPSLNGLTRTAWTASNRVLVVTEPGLFSVAAADRALRASNELRKRTAKDLQPLGIVLNRVRPSSREHSFRINELKDMFGPLVVNPPLPERTVLQQAQGSARPIHQWPGAPASELARAFDKILDRALRSENIRGRRPVEVAPSTNEIPTTSQEPQKLRGQAERSRDEAPRPKINRFSDTQRTAPEAQQTMRIGTVPAENPVRPQTRSADRHGPARLSGLADKFRSTDQAGPVEKPGSSTPTGPRSDGSYPSRRDLRRR
ncbi:MULTISPECIES: ParA family protein [unclassified Brevibacterium]|uniref:ParA family protein n=1 Tax=unclassified Brevibacterium TaxID=2614124 RepID=UPI0009F2D8C5|nr:ParA family protein [Brevibacterium sp. Marseille-P9724]